MYKRQRISYTEAIEILKKNNKKFQYPVEWGVDIQTEHELSLIHISHRTYLLSQKRISTRRPGQTIRKRGRGKMKMTAQEYARRVQKAGPHSPLLADCL